MVLEGDPEGNISSNRILDIVKLCLNGQVLPGGEVVDKNGKSLGTSVLKNTNLKKLYQPRTTKRGKRPRRDAWAFSDED